MALTRFAWLALACSLLASAVRSEEPLLAAPPKPDPLDTVRAFVVAWRTGDAPAGLALCGGAAARQVPANFARFKAGMMKLDEYVNYGVPVVREKFAFVSFAVTFVTGTEKQTMDFAMVLKESGGKYRVTCLQPGKTPPVNKEAYSDDTVLDAQRQKELLDRADKMVEALRRSEPGKGP